jgi:hypothetical protein
METMKLPVADTTAEGATSNSAFKKSVDEIYRDLQSASDKTRALIDDFPSQASERLNSVVKEAEEHAFQLGNALDCCS